jgi:hypothetical protein
LIEDSRVVFVREGLFKRMTGPKVKRASQGRGRALELRAGRLRESEREGAKKIRSKKEERKNYEK